MTDHWLRLSSEIVYAGRVKIARHQVQLPNGDRSDYEVDESLPFAVAVLVLAGERAILAHQYRYPLDRWILDLPGGAGELGESPEAAARRELLEELGIEVGELVFLQKFYPNPGRSSWPVFLFLGAVRSQQDSPSSDPWEEVGAKSVAFSELSQLICRGEVWDPSLLIAWQSANLKGLIRPGRTDLVGR